MYLGETWSTLRSRFGNGRGPRGAPAVQVFKERASCSHSQIANCTFHIISVLAIGIKKKEVAAGIPGTPNPVLPTGAGSLAIAGDPTEGRGLEFIRLMAKKRQA